MNRPSSLRVALISYEFPPETLGGIGTYAQHAVESLSAQGHNLTVFTATTSTTTRIERAGEARVIRLQCSDRRKFHQTATIALAAEHALRPFDVAEVPDLYAEGAGLRARTPTLPIVLRAHTPAYIPSRVDFEAVPAVVRYCSAVRRICGGLLHHEPWKKIRSDALARVNFRHAYRPGEDRERLVALEADLVASPSQRLAQRLQADWGLPASRLRVVPYAHIPAPELLALPPSTQAKTIAFHGGVRLFKGVHVLVAAMKRVLVRYPNVRLILAGASGASPVALLSMRAWLDDAIISWRDTINWLEPDLAQLGSSAVWRGFIGPEHLPTHLGEADVCVFPSLFDNFPSACLEAMSAGRSIIGTRSGGMEEMLGHDEAGLLVAPGDVCALARAICRLLADADLRSHLAVRARQRVLSTYGASIIGPKHTQLYKDAITRHGAGVSS